MDISLGRVLEAARERRATLTPEVAGYVILLATRQVEGDRARLSADSVLLDEAGDVLVVRDGVASERSVEAALRGLLGALVGLCASPPPAIAAVASREASGDLRALGDELSAALIPINHAAAHRALARLYRETRRAQGHVTDIALPPISDQRPEPEAVELDIDVVVEVVEAESERERASAAPPLDGGAGTAVEPSAPAELPRAEPVVEAAAPAEVAEAEPVVEPAAPAEAAEAEAVVEPAVPAELPRAEPLEAELSEAEPPEAEPELTVLPPVAPVAELELARLALSMASAPSSVDAPADARARDGAPEREPAPPALERHDPYTCEVHSDVYELLDAFLAETRSVEHMPPALRKMIGLELRPQTGTEPPTASVPH